MPSKFLLLVLPCACIHAASVVEKHPQREFIIHSLQRLVDERSPTTENHFFILSKKAGKDWVYWREGRLLWITDLTPYYEKRRLAELHAGAVWDLRLRAPTKPIDLDTDVVPASDKIGSSTYFETKAYVADIVYDCVQDGELLTLEKKKTNQSAQPAQPKGG